MRGVQQQNDSTSVSLPILVYIVVLIRSFFCVYLVVSIPLRLAFIPEYDIDLQQYGIFVVLDFFSTVFFIGETISVKFRGWQRVVPLQEHLEDERNEDSVENAAPWWGTESQLLLLSIVASVPLEYIVLFLVDSRTNSTNYFLMNRFIRVLYLPAYINDISKCLELKGVLKNVGLHRTWKLFFTMAIAGHWCGCGFFYIAKEEAMNGEITWPEDIGIFITKVVIPNNSSTIKMEPTIEIEMLTNIPYAYILSLYWAYITMITTGFGDIVPISIPETLWCIFSMSLGVIITTCAIANLQLLVTNMDAAFTDFQRKTETIKKYMRYRRLPSNLQNRIMSFYHYQWDLLKGADEEKFLSELPSSLQQQVANFMCRDLIASLPVLRKANTSLLNALADCAEINIYSPNDNVLKPGDQIRGTVLVSRGDLEVLTGNRVERKMKRFDSYAEEALFIKTTCSQTVRAKTFSEIFVLPSDDFQQIIKAQCDPSHVLQMKETALMITKNATKANKLFGSAEEACKMHGFKKLCHPESDFRRIWDFIILLGYLYYIFSLPLVVMKLPENNMHSNDIFSIASACLVDSIFVLDLFFRFQCFMYYEEGLIVFDQERIRHKFSQDNSVIGQIITAFPFDFLALAFSYRLFNILRISKILRLSGVIKCIARLERTLAHFKLGGDHTFLRVIKLNFLLIIVCHWVGCLWFYCADLSIELGLSTNWRMVDEEDKSLSIEHSDFGGFSAYLRSIYWAIVSMSTVGYGDIIPTNALETTFTTIVILFGGLMLPAIVGGLAAYLSNLNLATRAHRQRIALAKQYMKHCSMDDILIERVMNYYDYVWSRQGAIDEESILNELPGPLRQNVAIFVNQVHIDAAPFFTVCDDAIKELLVAILKPRVFMPLDSIVQESEVGTEMFFIEKGKVAVLSKEGIVISFLSKGDYFGESVLLSTVARICSVKSLTYCDTFVLNKDDYYGIMVAHSTHQQKKEICDIIEEGIQKKMKVYNNIVHNIKERSKCLKRLSILSLKEDYYFPGETSGATFSYRAPFRPDSKFVGLWNILIMFISIYNAWAVPFRLAFSTGLSHYYIDWALDCFLLFDMFLHYCRFAFVHEGELIDDIDRVKQRYIHGNFKVDLFSVVPCDVIIYFSGQSNRKIMVMATLRIPKLLRLGRLPSILRDVFRVLEDMNLPLAPLRLVEFLSGVILIAHWAACGFYAFARWGNNRDCMGLDQSSVSLNIWATEYAECRWEDTWIKRQVINDKITIDGGQVWQRYLRSFNWALPTLVVVVIGDVVPVTSAETLYAFVWMVVGVTINAAIIGNVANIVANIDTSSSNFAKKVDEIKKLMHEHHVSQHLHDRVNQFLIFLWEHEGAQSEDSFVKELPYTLQLQVTEHTRQRHISSCPFFDFCSNDIVKALSLRLKHLLFSKGDILVNFGDMGQEMFFLERGSVEVLSEDWKTTFATLSTGMDGTDCCKESRSVFFGETSLFFKRKRANTVRAISFCEVYQLGKVDLDNELRQRDFNLSRMLSVFTAVADSNERRNNALASNLEISKLKQSKLSKLVNPEENVMVSGRKVNKRFLPNSSFRIGWDFTCILFTIYNIVVIPFRAVFFIEPLSKIPTWLIFEFCIDCFFIIDFYLRYCMFAVIKHGSIITDKEKISKKYRHTGMLYDIFACLPVELLLLIYGIDYIMPSRLLHMARVFRLPTYFEHADGYLNIWNIRIDAATGLLMRMFFYYALVIHWCGCIWFAIHRFLEHNIQYTWVTTDCPGGQVDASNGCLAAWVQDHGTHDICNGGLIGRCYARSIYFVITTLSTVGYGMCIFVKTESKGLTFLPNIVPYYLYSDVSIVIR